MGAFDSSQDITIPDPSDPSEEKKFRYKWGWDANEQIIIKSKLSVADSIYVANNYASKGKNNELEMQMGEGRYSLLHRMIVTWTLTGDGKQIPLNKQNIYHLPSQYSTPVLDAIDKLSGPMEEKEQEDFLNSVIDATSENLNMTKMHRLK